MTVKRQETNCSMSLSGLVFSSWMWSSDSPSAHFFGWWEESKGPNSLQERVTHLSDPTPFPRLQERYCLFPSRLLPLLISLSNRSFISFYLPCGEPVCSWARVVLSAPCPLWLISVWACACCSKIWNRNSSKQACRRYLRRVTTGVLERWHQEGL